MVAIVDQLKRITFAVDLAYDAAEVGLMAV